MVNSCILSFITDYTNCIIHIEFFFPNKVDVRSLSLCPHHTMRIRWPNFYDLFIMDCLTCTISLLLLTSLLKRIKCFLISDKIY